MIVPSDGERCGCYEFVNCQCADVPNDHDPCYCVRDECRCVQDVTPVSSDDG